MKKLISMLLVALLALSMVAFAAAEESTSWAYAGITLDGLGTIWYAADYFDIDDIVNPTAGEPYTEEELAAIIDSAVDGAEDYRFDVPEGALLGFAIADSDVIFWYDADNGAAITSHADPLSIDESGVFTTADGETVATPIE